MIKKEEIESLGFDTFVHDDPGEDFGFTFYKEGGELGRLCVVHYPSNPKYTISTHDMPVTRAVQLFEGVIKDKAEFLTILKQLSL